MKTETTISLFRVEALVEELLKEKDYHTRMGSDPRFLRNALTGVRYDIAYADGLDRAAACLSSLVREALSLEVQS